MEGLDRNRKRKFSIAFDCLIRGNKETEEPPKKIFLYRRQNLEPSIERDSVGKLWANNYLKRKFHDAFDYLICKKKSSYEPPIKKLRTNKILSISSNSMDYNGKKLPAEAKRQTKRDKRNSLIVNRKKCSRRALPLPMKPPLKRSRNEIEDVYTESVPTNKTLSISSNSINNNDKKLTIKKKSKTLRKRQPKSEKMNSLIVNRKKRRKRACSLSMQPPLKQSRNEIDVSRESASVSCQVNTAKITSSEIKVTADLVIKFINSNEVRGIHDSREDVNINSINLTII